jgi:23S rRNA (guanine745-N1)-methyltransferase
VAPAAPGLSLLDSGCGTGYYLSRMLEQRVDWRALALDVSVDAVALATRAAHSPGVVADVWQALPVRDGRADVVLCVFAPRNVSEFARVLAPGGRLIVVTPSRNHLRQLRDAGRVIGMQEDKLAHLDGTLAPTFRLERREALEYDVVLDDAEVSSLASMGPSGHHAMSDGRTDVGADVGAEGPGDVQRSDGSTVTVAVDVSAYSPA